MLNSMRNSVGSIWAKILLGLLVVAFAAWGLEGVFAARTQTVAAKVGNAEINVQDFARTFDNRLRALRARTGSNITPEDARRSGYDRLVLDELVTETALDEEAVALGIAASDRAVSDAIIDFPQFKDAYGKFDRTAYEASLRRNRLRQDEFEEGIRRDLARDALLQSIGNGTTAPRTLAETLYKYRNEKRSFDYIELSLSDVEDPGEPTDEQLSTFHQENAVRFTAPEFRKVSYVALTVKDIAAGLDRTEEDLKAEYNARIESYTTPERRRVEQMVFDTEEEAKEAAQKITDGESFAKLAESKGLSAQDVSLGSQTKAELPGALAEAAFAPTEPGMVDPVGTALGWSLLNIVSIDPQKIVTFDEAKDDLKTELTTTEARQIVPEKSVDLDDQIAGGSTLKEAAEQTGARYAEIVAIDATGRDPNGDRVADLPEDPEFLARLFDTDVSEDISLIEGSNGDYFSINVEEITEAALRPLDTIKGQVSGAWEVAEREKALEALTATHVEKLNGGTELTDLAEELELEVKTAGPGTRSDRTLGLSTDLLADIFDAEEGNALEGAAANNLTRVVGTLTEIVQATSEEDVTAIDRSTEAYAGRLSRDFVDQFTRTARARHPAQHNQQAIDAVFTNPGYGGGY